MNPQPFHAILCAHGLHASYKLSGEHLKKIWDTLETARILDDAKERLATEVLNQKKEPNETNDIQ